jgi:ATP synthase mitochondrial F1 complex assembly factor 2
MISFPLSSLVLTMISFQEEYPPQLVKLQKEHWDPLLDWVRSEYKVDIRTFDSVLVNSQPEETRETFQAVLRDMDQWTLAGMSNNIYS